MGSLETICGIVVVIVAFYYYLISIFDFWKSRGISGPQPVVLFGNVRDVMFGRKAMCDYLMEIYNIYKDKPMIGIFVRRTPVLIVKDPDLIKDILIKDFSNFAERGFTTHEKADPLSQHLVALEQKRWRPLRTKLSPVFTSARYTTDVIGSCAFGLDTNSLSDVDSEFLQMGREAFTPKWYNLIRLRIKQSTPWLFDILGYILPQTKVTKFFTRIVMENIDYREKNNIVRHDFVDTLRELKSHPHEIDIELTDSLIASQAFIFFLAGFETSSTTMTNALYELAQNHKIQDTLREEINQEYAKNDGVLTYDNIKKMDYLDKVFKETLRKYPPATFLMRQSTSSYTFDSIKINIPKGQPIWIPVYAIQRDPNIYPNPNVFDPERFKEEVTRNAMFYLPFGDGPRKCIGSRFAVYQTKIGLIKILRNYNIEICEKSQIPYTNDPKAFLLTPKGGIYLKIIKINGV
ncbi:cytochrome P450 6A1-like isoform X2 [Odontomachus brunneus]|uniref:cytochrome P450 6A1-like isoform X2 n=1 Tax=Odontomachus brunneus TaxID=486640 RepID=UPI0013F20968|nr:cytochrome P450 6A1-like isoform X2 [Odontomachus brunneus]XP_032690821.1 cytochrome P450 6A1-like isoform X2 [Odontomachus brunneus]